MQAGLLNEIISVEQPIVSRSDEYSSKSLIKWQNFIKQTKANVTYTSGNRVNENNEIIFAYEVVFKVRIYHQIDERMRIIWKNKKYRILSIEPNKKLQILTIKAELIND